MPISPDKVKTWMDNGVMFSISLLVIWALALGVFLLYKWLNGKIEEGKNDCSKCAYTTEARTPQDLLNHRIFSTIRNARIVRIPHLPIREVGRRMVFRDLLDVKFRAVATHFNGWITAHLKDLEDMTADHIGAEMMVLIATIVESYETECKRMGIPEVAMTSFSIWHLPRVNQLQSEVKLICESGWISDEVERVGVILSMVDQVMRMTVFDAEKAMDSLNGTLTGKEYKGFTIGDCPRRDPNSNPGTLMMEPTRA